MTDRLKNGRSWSFAFFFFAHSNDIGYVILVFTRNLHLRKCTIVTTSSSLYTRTLSPLGHGGVNQHTLPVRRPLEKQHCPPSLPPYTAGAGNWRLQRGGEGGGLFSIHLLDSPLPPPPSSLSRKRRLRLSCSVLPASLPPVIPAALLSFSLSSPSPFLPPVNFVKKGGGQRRRGRKSREERNLLSASSQRMPSLSLYFVSFFSRPASSPSLASLGPPWGIRPANGEEEAGYEGRPEFGTGLQFSLLREAAGLSVASCQNFAPLFGLPCRERKKAYGEKPFSPCNLSAFETLACWHAMGPARVEGEGGDVYWPQILARGAFLSGGPPSSARYKWRYLGRRRKEGGVSSAPRPPSLRLSRFMV